MSPVTATSAVALALALAVPAGSRAGGNAAAGQGKSLTCTACHVAPDPSSDTPYLAGQREAYLSGQLQAFRSGDRVHPLMDGIARQLNDADIADLAAFWSAQPVGSDAHPSTPEAARAAAAIRLSHMRFPPDFPTGFTRYLTANDAEHRTIKQHYINALGLAAARRNQPLPPGTIILQVNCLARLGPDGQPLHAPDGAWIIDRITSYTGMELHPGWGNPIPPWLRNADWNYGSFTTAKIPNPDTNQAVCLACHKPQSAVSYVFTFNELWDAARGQ